MHQNIQENNYVYIPNFISPERAKELASNYKKFCESENLQGDIQAPDSHSSYNYIEFLELLCEKTPEVSKFLGETVLPTYAYSRVYKNGSVLDRHRDRHACEISLTLHLASDDEWPIYIEKPNGEEVGLNLNSGDAMLYLGCQADHWRDKFNGQNYIQVFLHYVRSRGENNFAYFDKSKDRSDKQTIAMPKYMQAKTEQIVNKPKHKFDLKDYIVEFENIVPDDLCDKILNEYVNSNDWGPTYVGQGVVDKKLRNVDTIYISNRNVIQVNPNIRQELDNLLFKCANNAIRKYNELFPLAEIQEDSGYELLRYSVGQFYVEHTDSFKDRPRAVSCSFCLNDNYEGGEFSFWNGEKFIKGKKGSVIMFPSNFQYPHAIMPVTKGTRYSIITWFV